MAGNIELPDDLRGIALDPLKFDRDCKYRKVSPRHFTEGYVDSNPYNGSMQMENRPYLHNFSMLIDENSLDQSDSSDKNLPAISPTALNDMVLFPQSYNVLETRDENVHYDNGLTYTELNSASTSHMSYHLDEEILRSNDCSQYSEEFPSTYSPSGPTGNSQYLQFGTAFPPIEISENSQNQQFVSALASSETRGNSRTNGRQRRNIISRSTYEELTEEQRLHRSRAINKTCIEKYHENRRAEVRSLEEEFTGLSLERDILIDRFNQTQKQVDILNTVINRRKLQNKKSLQ